MWLTELSSRCGLSVNTVTHSCFATCLFPHMSSLVTWSFLQTLQPPPSSHKTLSPWRHWNPHNTVTDPWIIYPFSPTQYSRTRLWFHERDWIFCVVITEECNVTVNSGVLIGTAEYLALQTRCCIHRCRYNQVRLHFYPTELFRCSFACVICTPTNRPYIPALASDAPEIMFFSSSTHISWHLIHGYIFPYLNKFCGGSFFYSIKSDDVRYKLKIPSIRIIFTDM